ncbi:uncharacterized protein PAC_04288 [Phialocephala subalpina]|uniref:DUF899 domain protein n=1 Tax=Phialocephala subalpina TaxID=576137 RepID=A0A1L7WNR7_9HELO|nr:uncharacterized protein PAC_04288 [Phialocephala subalpina]
MPGKIVSQEEWLTARKDLLDKEKAATRANDAFNETFRDFPIVKLEKQYTFDGPNGKATLTDLFEGRKQLIVYHFMLGPDDDAGCTGCSFVGDNLPSSLAHLNTRNTTLVLVSRAPLAKIEAFKKRMGWNLPWVSSSESDFNYDFHVSLDASIAPTEYNYKESAPDVKGERPGLSIFYREGAELYHSYSTYARGLDGILVTNRLLDLTPLGRQDAGKDGWKLHDEYSEDEKKGGSK